MTDALERDIVFSPRRGKQSVLGAFAYCLNPATPAGLQEHPARMSIIEAQRRLHNLPRSNLPSTVAGHSGVLRKSAKFVEVAHSQMERRVEDWTSTLEPWDLIVEEARALFGEHWAFYHLANVASGIKSRDETYQDHPDLFDSSKSLCRRVRYARLRAGSAKWWRHHLNRASTDEEKALALLILLTWGSAKTLSALLVLINDMIAKLPVDSWLRLARSLKLPRDRFLSLSRPTKKCNFRCGICLARSRSVPCAL